MIAPGLLLLADSRLPTGGHAHSGGIEAAAARGLIAGPADVERFLAARAPTAGLVAAAAAAAACVRARDLRGHGTGDDARGWDAALSARIPTAALRAVSRAQGRAMLRTVRATWPSIDTAGLGARPHQAFVLGVAASAAGAGPGDAAALAIHHLIGQACSAAVRLLGLDPLALAGVHARALALASRTITDATDAGIDAACADDPTLLPTASTPLPEILAVAHARTEGALFAS